PEAEAEAPEADTAETETPEAEPEGAEVAGAEQAAADPSVDPGAVGLPFDPTAVRIETRALTVDVLVQRIAEGGIDLAPAGDGSPIWTEVARSRLVESLLLRVPLPAFYFDAGAPDSWAVVDGLHRLAALDAFVNHGAFGLSGLEFFDHLEGKTFKELPRHFQRRILETQVTGHLIQEGTPEPVRTAIIRRIDTGSGRSS
ncbi:MAG: DUF262 domain-containing protein, partial [Rhodospirillales bacterium]|nr:DUF262 domain-containing protein [Rhodospirillales bacterium]